MRIKVFMITIFLGIDQISKFLVEHFLTNQKLEIIPNFFSIDLNYNTGVAFSFFQNHILLIIIFSILCLFFLMTTEKEIAPSKIKKLSYSLLYAGILGNLIDRIFLGKVRDFLDFSFYQYHFPTFNFADVCIVIGALLLLFLFFIRKEVDYEDNQEKDYC